jgi:radical SAM superfamily enzyme YgiQ (UPF0313 family)
MKSKNILLVQLPVPALVNEKATGNIPMAGAMLRLHARAGKKKLALEPVLFPAADQNRMGDAALLESLRAAEPAVIGFTVTVWNIERTLYLAEQIKQRNPEIKIWLGGPEVAEDAFFIQDPGAPFDLAVEGEGETIFTALVSGQRPEMINGLLLPGGRKTKYPAPVPCLKNLDATHDPFIRNLVQPEADGVMLAEFRRGCRYRCAFCRYQQGRHGPALSKSAAQIKEIFSWARRHGVREICLLDPSLEQRPDIKEFLDLLAVANRRPSIPLFVELRCDRLPAGLAEKAYAAGVREVETGLQTLDPDVLRKLGRPSSSREFAAGARALQKLGIRVKIDLMFGLPGQSEKEWRRSLRFVKEEGLSGSVQAFRTQVLPGTRLRQKAREWGLAYEARPPYLTLSTPAWPAESLENGLVFAEDILGVSFSPDDQPEFCTLPGGAARVGTSHAGVGVVHSYGFNLDLARGRGSLAGEEFGKAAAAVTLRIRTGAPQRDLALVRDAAARFVRNNPFSSLCLAVEIPANGPLNIFDALDAAFGQNQLSRYVERLYYPVLPYRRPQRRLFAVLNRKQQAASNRGWLAEVRRLAEIIPA